MTRSLKPFVIRTGRVINGTYYRSSDDAPGSVTGLPTLPPERVGINGEYDYYGLANRVNLALCQHFGPEIISQLDIHQRGSAIMLSGKIMSRALVERLVQFILEMDGASQVELRHLHVIEIPYSRLPSSPLTPVQA